MGRASREVRVARVVFGSCLEVSRPGLAVMGSLVAVMVAAEIEEV